jgi:DNA-binding Lrp family transcriptional regulator
MNKIIDDKDRKILEILEENSTLSAYKISKNTLIPVTTVNNRIKKLKKLGVIRKFTVDIDKTKLGLNLSAYIFINLSLKELKEANITVKDLVRMIKKNPCIESVDNVTGDVDIILKINAGDINEVNDYVVNTISQIKGIEKTKTALILTKD